MFAIPQLTHLQYLHTMKLRSYLGRETKSMFKISAFAKMSGISIKTLRYYDELGILKPSAVDESSGYRFYSADQLLTVERIRAYKELGLTLEQIAPLLQDEGTPGTAAGTLAMKRADLETAIQEAQRQLEEIDRRMQRLEQVGAAAVDGSEAVTLRELQPQWAASVRDTIPRQDLCLLVNEVRDYVMANGCGTADGPLILLWHDAGGNGEREVIDIEVAFPLEEPTPERGRVRIVELPGYETAASLIHDCNPYAAHCPAAAHVMAWAASQGYEPLPGEPVREVYIAAERDMYGKFRRSEVFLPLRGTL